MTDILLISLDTVLSKYEKEFVETVFRYSGCKLDSGTATKWINDGSEYGKTVCLWENPEKLGLIKCVGSYKWEPNDNILTLAIKKISKRT